MGSFRGVCTVQQQQMRRTDSELATLYTPMRTMLAYLRMIVLWGSLWGAVAGAADTSAIWMALKSGETGSGKSHTTIFTIKATYFPIFGGCLCLYHMFFFTEMESLCTDGQIAPISATKRGLSGLTWEGIASCSVATCYQRSLVVRTGCPWA